MYWIVLPVLWVSCYVSVLFSSSYVKNLVFGKSAAEVVHAECLHSAQMLHFVCDVQDSYHVSTVHKTGNSLHYRKS